MENFIKQDLPRGIILRAMHTKISQGGACKGSPGQRAETSSFHGSVGLFRLIAPPNTVPPLEWDLSLPTVSLQPVSFHNGRLRPLIISPKPFPLLLTPTPSFLPLSPPAPYHNASRWAKVQLNDKSILPSQEGDLSRRYEEEWPWDHWFIWLPPRGQDTEDFQLLLRLKLTVRMKRKEKCQERGTPFFPRPDLPEPK